MGKSAEFAVYDPVELNLGGTADHLGHIARKEAKKAVVVTANDDNLYVPWRLLSLDRQGRRKRVTAALDQEKAQFRPDDKVRFPNGSGTLHGVIARFGPKRAVVVTERDKTYLVPYRQLTHVGWKGFRRDAKHLQSVTRQAERLISLHGLKRWSFQFDDALKRAGSCSFATKVITLSRLYCLKASNADVRDTILHEIAHALAGPDHHHDKVWREKARAIGCTAERCHNVEFAPSRYIKFCEVCGWYRKANFRRRNTVCKRCRRRPRYKDFTKEAWERMAFGPPFV